MTCQVSVYVHFWMFFQNEINAGDFTKFCHGWRSAGGRLEVGWRSAGGRLEVGWRSAGVSTEMLESPMECYIIWERVPNLSRDVPSSETANLSSLLLEFSFSSAHIF